MVWIKGILPTEEHKRKISKSLKGHKGWNEGLTKETDVRVKRAASNISAGLKKYYKNNPDPKCGFRKNGTTFYNWTGKTHSQETKERMSRARKT